MITLRPAAPAERAALVALMRRASLANPGDRDALLAHPEAIDVPVEHLERRRVTAAHDGDTLVGFATLLPRDDGDAEIDALFVEPAAWRRGVGRRLVEALVATARAEGARAVHVVANPHALAFYRAAGFELVEAVATRFGPAMTMRADCSRCLAGPS